MSRGEMQAVNMNMNTQSEYLDQGNGNGLLRGEGWSWNQGRPPGGKIN